MFNGIIKKTGKLKKIKMSKSNCNIEILSKIKFSKKEIGSSISCSGACLTLEKINNKSFTFSCKNGNEVPWIWSSCC